MVLYITYEGGSDKTIKKRYDKIIIWTNRGEYLFDGENDRCIWDGEYFIYNDLFDMLRIEIDKSIIKRIDFVGGDNNGE